jgi:rod shape-determining protein MreC
MYTLRRWWDRYRMPIVSSGLALAAGLGLWSTKGAPVTELYRLFSLPGQGRSPQLSPGPVPLLSKGQENAQLLELQQRLVELESQNQRLKKIVGYLAEDPKQLIPAPVIGRSTNQWSQNITLGRGSQDGIKPGDVVTAPGGLVGRIDAVTPHTARVLLLIDATSKVGVKISRSGATGMMRGLSPKDPKRLAVIEFLDKNPDVRKGDWIATSQLSSLFPSGMPIGRIEEFHGETSPAPTATVALSAPLNNLDWVVVKPYTTSDRPLPPYNPSGVPPKPAASPGANAPGINAPGTASPAPAATASPSASASPMP